MKCLRLRGSRRPTAVLLVPLLLLGLLACGDDNDRDATPSGLATAAASETSQLQGEVIIFAASSLAEVFEALAGEFRTLHPDLEVTFNFQSSSALAVQINEGAPADVFASANDAQMAVVTDEGNASDPRTFATNSLVVVVPTDSDAVTSFEDLAAPGLRLVLAGEDVPIGAYAREVLANVAAATGGPGATFAGDVLANLQSNEASVRAVLTKVELGEADAGIVYRTDAAVSGDGVTIIEIPAEYNVVASYPLAVVNEAANSAAAAAWVEFVLSEEGQAILARFGFGPVE